MGRHRKHDTIQLASQDEDDDASAEDTGGDDWADRMTRANVMGLSLAEYDDLPAEEAGEWPGDDQAEAMPWRSDGDWLQVDRALNLIADPAWQGLPDIARRAAVVLMAECDGPVSESVYGYRPASPDDVPVLEGKVVGKPRAGRTRKPKPVEAGQ